MASTGFKPINPMKKAEVLHELSTVWGEECRESNTVIVLKELCAALQLPYSSDAMACACGCDCGVDDGHILDDDEDPVNWSCCECKCCGIAGQGCKMHCSEILRVNLAQKRGEDAAALVSAYDENGVLNHDEIKKENPKFCGDCREHGLIELRRKAVQRSRKRHVDAEKDGSAEPLTKKQCNATE